MSYAAYAQEREEMHGEKKHLLASLKQFEKTRRSMELMVKERDDEMETRNRLLAELQQEQSERRSLQAENRSLSEQHSV
jgi:hypothetical protein